MSKRPTFQDFKKDALKDKAFKAEYELLGPEFEVISAFIRARKRARISQQELADSLSMRQPSIARLERGGYASTSVSKLAKVADALGYSMKISLSPKKPKKKL